MVRGIFASYGWKSRKFKRQADKYSKWSIGMMLFSLVSLFVLPEAGLAKVWAYGIALIFLCVAALLRNKYRQLQVKDSRLLTK